MSTDTLVDRLRGKYEVGPDAEFGTRDFSKFIPPISLEAADYIEELEDELANAIEYIENSGIDWNEIKSNPIMITLQQIKD